MSTGLNTQIKMFSSKLLQITKNPSNLSMPQRLKSNYQMKETADKCVTCFQGIRNSCVKKEGKGCRRASSSIKCVKISSERICEKIRPPTMSFREKLHSENRHIRKPCPNECCCMDYFVDKVKDCKLKY